MFLLFRWVKESCSLKLRIVQALKPVASSFTLLITNIYRQRIGLWMSFFSFLQNWRKFQTPLNVIKYYCILLQSPIYKSSSRTILRILTLNHLYKKFCDSGYCWVLKIFACKLIVLIIRNCHVLGEDFRILHNFTKGLCWWHCLRELKEH